MTEHYFEFKQRIGVVCEGGAMVDVLTENIKVSKEYYDSDDAFNFYILFGGGNHIHVGFYDGIKMTGIERINAASHASFNHLLEKADHHSVEPLGPRSRLMDMGSAYGGSARLCAQRWGCSVTCIDMSKRENDVNRAESQRAGLADLIEIPGERSFTDTGMESATYNMVYSLDSFDHAGSMVECIVKEASRVLKKNGLFVFTDLMQSDNANPAEMKPVYDRLHLETMSYPAKYKELAAKHGLEFIEFEERTMDMLTHYSAVRDELVRKMPELKGKISDSFLKNMANGLDVWVDHAKKGNLCWGFFVFRKL